MPARPRSGRYGRGGRLGFHVECRLCGCDNRRVRYRWLLAGLGMFAGTLVLTTALIGLAAASGPVSASGPAAGPVRYRPIGCVRRGPAIAYSHGPRRKEVALSFDDGPFPLTPSFVQMLKANNALATFFMIGDQVTRATVRPSRELRDGDALGDHTYTHPDLLTAGGVQVNCSARSTRFVACPAIRRACSAHPMATTTALSEHRRLARPGDDPVGSRSQRLHPARRLGDRAARTGAGQARRDRALP